MKRNMVISFLGGEQDNTHVRIIDRFTGDMIAEFNETYPSLHEAVDAHAANQRDYGYQVYRGDVQYHDNGQQVVVLTLNK